MSSDRTAAHVPTSVLRAALIGVGLAATWFAASAILDAPAANAAEMAPTTASTGLVGGLTDGLLDTVDSTLGSVADIADSGTVSAVIAPVSETVDTVVVEVVAPRAPLPHLPVGRAVWRPAPSFAVSAAAWLTAGAAHHTVMSTAVGVEVFEDFAAIAKTELLTIDEGTTLRAFTNEVRWNQAYYRLAQGL